MIAAPFQKQNYRVIFPDIFSFPKLDQLGGFVANLMDNGILQLSQLQWNKKKVTNYNFQFSQREKSLLQASIIL